MENITSWNVERVWGSNRFYHEGDVASTTYAFVIDSGVSLATNDLNINYEWSKSFTPTADPFDDVSGHGTSVASVIGAKANYQGLTGVAPGAQIVSLKVFDGRYTTPQRVSNAIEYAGSIILNNNLTDTAVINLSLGGFTADRHPIITEMADQGVKFAIAAGNRSIDVDEYSPASYGDHENVFTVSANEKNGRHSRFTNFDGGDDVDDVDYSAPGTAVLAYDKDGSIRTVNGTSFAAPHVAGLLLMGDIKEGELQAPSSDMREAGANSDPLALFDEDAYRFAPEPDYGIPDDVAVPDTTNVITSDNKPRNRLKGTFENDLIIGGDNRDFIRGYSGDDLLIAGGKRDYLMGGNGNDVLVSSQNSRLNGGDGADVFVLTGDGVARIIDYNPEEGDTIVMPAGDVYEHERNRRRNWNSLYVDDELVAQFLGKVDDVF